MTAPLNSQQVAIYYCKQTVEGELPASPVFQKLAFTGGIPNEQRDNLEGSEIDGSPDKTGSRLGNRRTEFEPSIILSYGIYDDLLAGAMQSSWNTGPTLSSKSVQVIAASRQIKILGEDVTSQISADESIKIASLTLGANAEPHFVTGITFDGTDTVIDIGIAPLTIPQQGIVGIEDESATADVKVSDWIKLESDRAFFALLIEYQDFLGTTKYDLVLDNVVTGFNFNVAVNANITGGLPMTGRTYVPDYGLPAGATLNDVPAHKFLSGLDGCVTRDGEKQLLVTSADMTLDRGASPQYETCSEYMSHVSFTKADNSISISAGFVDYTLLDQFQADVYGNFTIRASFDGKAMSWTYPNSKVTGLDRDLPDGDVTQSATLNAYKPAGAVSSLIIRRVE